MSTTESKQAPLRVVAVSGSLRNNSLNTLLLNIIGEELARQGVKIEHLSLNENALPFYNGDYEENLGVPRAAHYLRGRIHAADGLLIATPEYNGSISGVLKNALDWCSRPTEGLVALQPFTMKPVLLASASISPFGGVRALGHLRAILGKMGALVFPNDFAVPFADKALSAEGFSSEQAGAMMSQLVGSFVEFLEGKQEWRASA